MKAVVAWGLAVPLVVWAVVRWFGWEQGAPVVAAMAFTPYAILLGLPAALLAVALRRPIAAAVAFLACCVLAAGVLPRFVAEGAVMRPAGPVLRVLAVRAPTDPAALARLLNDVDVLVAPGLDADVLPFRAGAVQARFPVRGDGTVEVPDTAGIQVVPVLLAPMTDVLEWTRGLAALPRAGGSGPIRILAGDFEATLDHAALRELRDRGYRDAAETHGVGWQTTWPVDRTWPPPLTLDHVLVDRRVLVTDARTRRVPGSTHMGVYANLRLPGTGR